MDNLSKFYFMLSTDSVKKEMFMSASNDVKEKMLKSAGIDNGHEIISLDQEQLQKLMAKNLAAKSSEWSNLSSNANNNSVDDIGRLGL